MRQIMPLRSRAAAIVNECDNMPERAGACRSVPLVSSRPPITQDMQSFIRRLSYQVGWVLDWRHRQERRRWFQDFNARQAQELGDRDLVYYARGLGNSPDFRRACQAEARRRGVADA